MKSNIKPFPMLAYSAGQTRGKAEGNLPAHARAAASGWKVSPAHGVRAGEREAQTHGLHEQERRFHQPAGAGAGEVTAQARRGRGGAARGGAALSSGPLPSTGQISIRDPGALAWGLIRNFWTVCREGDRLCLELLMWLCWAFIQVGQHTDVKSQKGTLKELPF